MTGQQNNSVPATATEWLIFVRSLSDEFDALAPVERHKRLVERYLCSKGLEPLDFDCRSEGVSSPEDQR